MTLRANWFDNEERACWEAVIGPYHAVARLDATSGRYVAYLENETTRGTDHYATDSFSDPEKAKAWCETEAQRLLDEQAALHGGPDALV
jgi:hypothetical protein